MKSGIYLALEAMTQLRKAGVSSKLPIRVLLTSDEESGSPSTRKLIEHTASAEKYVLVPEGSEPNGNLVSGRFPTTRFQIWTHGKPSHALLQRKEGSSALAAMAEVITKIESLNGENCSYTVTFVHAGHMVATVPMESYAEVICTAKTQAHLDEALSRLQSLVSGNSVTLTVKIKTCRPTWLPSEADRLLWERASAFAKDAGIQPDCEMLFGGSDGNFTGAMGIPTLDALGPVGANAHQLTENIDIGSLIPRGRILAGLMATLD
jgi:glutamate carboxypeptidase